MEKTFKTVGEYFHWVYANLAMAHATLNGGHQKYEQMDFIIRARLYKGLNDGTMHIASVYEDEKYKLSNVKCAYCGKTKSLTLDHLLSRKNGGQDSGDNLVYACKSCNSSKNKKDLLEWYTEKNEFPPVLVLRRYLKLAYSYYAVNGYLDLPFEAFNSCCDLFRLDLLPDKFPAPKDLKL